MTAQRQATEARLALLLPSGGTPDRLTGQQIQNLAEALGGILAALADAEAADKAKLYQELGLQLIYDEAANEIVAEAHPRSSVDLLVVSEGGVDPFVHDRSS
ncbi:hypothetical protein [Pseudofrankia asymbiotica]|uniref:hypothetical protein n=1 Tax=Pseudofrankia asymbiotica TaxID=1834516 RepID=UPI00105643AF|nr:hypothetical protein [Pseudofrankia asymbiotica]